VLEPAERTSWRVLFAAPFPPRLDGRHGGSRAIAQFLVRLAERHEVALAVLRAPDEPPVDESVKRACDVVAEVALPQVGASFNARAANRLRLRLALLRGMPTWAAERATGEFGERLERLGREWRPDIVQLEYRIMGQFLSALRGVTAKTVLVEHDPDLSAGASSRLLAPLEARAWRSLLRTAASRVDAVVVLTESDRSRVAELAGSTPVVRIPLGHDLPELSLDPRGTEPLSVVCIGSFVHPPNVDCALRLAYDIFPAVRKRVPGAMLRLVGSSAPSSVLALAGNGISVHADVPDVRPYLDAAAVFASPLRLGGGMRVKILEALTAGKAVVASPIALAGLTVRDGREVLVAESDEDFAGAIADLLDDPDRRAALAQRARRWAEENVSLDASVRSYETLYRSLLR